MFNGINTLKSLVPLQVMGAYVWQFICQYHLISNLHTECMDCDIGNKEQLTVDRHLEAHFGKALENTVPPQRSMIGSHLRSIKASFMLYPSNTHKLHLHGSSKGA